MPASGLSPLRIHINPTTNLSDVISVHDKTRIGLRVKFPVGALAGAYVIESSPEKTVTGTWKVIDETAVAFVAANAIEEGSSVDGNFDFIRVRATTPGNPAPVGVPANNPAGTPEVFLTFNNLSEQS